MTSTYAIILITCLFLAAIIGNIVASKTEKGLNVLPVFGELTLTKQLFILFSILIVVSTPIFWQQFTEFTRPVDPISELQTTNLTSVSTILAGESKDFYNGDIFITVRSVATGPFRVTFVVGGVGKEEKISENAPVGYSLTYTSSTNYDVRITKIGWGGFLQLTPSVEFSVIPIKNR